MAPGHQETTIPITVIGTVIQQTVILCPTKQTRVITNNKQEPTTGYALCLAGAAIVYRSKTQTVTALSSTEAEFYAAVAAAKIVRYIRMVLADLGYQQQNPTVIYEDNASAINIINSRTPTERSRHIDTPYFAIQDWKADGSILMKHIPGIINPSDDLTKPLGWVLHARHARRLMGHFRP